MVQPTLVVLDSDGKVLPELTWSWKTMGFAGDQDYVESPVAGVKVYACRPEIADLAAAIRERRPVKLANAGYG